MMRTLPEVQAAFASGVLQEDARGVEDVIVGDGLTPTARVQIYGNHVFTTLTAALEATFPVVCRLVDRRFFAFAANRYIRRHPPTGPCLFEYGATFSAFLASFPPCAGHPYLPDTARLEWAMNLATHAEDSEPIDPAALARVSPDDVGRVVFQIDLSASWVRSPWPIDRIWRANQPGSDPAGTVDLAAGGVTLEVRCRDDVLTMRALEEGEFAFRAELGSGATLETAAEAAAAADPTFDLTAALRSLLDEALITGFALAPPTPQAAPDTPITQAPQEGSARR
jgi:hypothetical protein